MWASVRVAIKNTTTTTILAGLFCVLCFIGVDWVKMREQVEFRFLGCWVAELLVCYFVACFRNWFHFYWNYDIHLNLRYRINTFINFYLSSLHFLQVCIRCLTANRFSGQHPALTNRYPCKYICITFVSHPWISAAKSSADLATH